MLRTGWEAFAATGRQRRVVNAAGHTTWFNWTQYPDHGPGAELLDPQPGATVVDLGCGKGGNTAHLAALGCHAIGVDIVARQLQDARARWGAAEHLRWVRSDALTFLGERRGSVHAVASVFGAVYFSDPDVLLPAIYDALTPGGRLGFSQPPPPGDSHGRRDSLPSTDGGTARILPRWDYSPGSWRDLLVRHGYECLGATIFDPPSGSDGAGTMLVHARKPTVR